jgi:predicted outer membrane repeat protein
MQLAVRRCRSLVAGAAVCAVSVAGAAAALLTAPSVASATTSVGTEAALRTAFGDPNETHIDLTADITLSATCPDGAVARTGTNPITVDGHGFSVTQTCTTGVSAVFSNPDGGALTFQNITISGGHSTGNGGAIFTQGGDVTVVNSTIENSTSASNGGGIAADVATVTLTDSTVSGNSSTSPNSGVGGGILANVVHATNSTVTGNSAAGSGGGIFAGEDTLVYSDVVGNTAPRGANLDVESSDTLESFASVVASPAGGGGNCYFGNGESTDSHGYNWDDDGSCGFGAGPGDRSDAGSPMLGALADNGGDTATLLPQTGSGLVDAVPNAACTADGASGITTDQRGSARPSPTGGACDIGAVEVAVVPPPPAPAAPAPLAVTPTFTG